MLALLHLISHRVEAVCEPDRLSFFTMKTLRLKPCLLIKIAAVRRMSRIKLSLILDLDPLLALDYKQPNAGATPENYCSGRDHFQA